MKVLKEKFRVAYLTVSEEGRELVFFND